MHLAHTRACSHRRTMMMRSTACARLLAVATLRPASVPSALGRRAVSLHATLSTSPDVEEAMEDAQWMAHALREASVAFDEGEVPIGAVLVRDGQVISTARNRVEATHDASAHAEMLCLRSAGSALSTWRLGEATLYVTVEPCAMCLAAAHGFRIDRLVYGATNPRMGAVESDMRAASDVAHPYHEVRVTGGVMADEASDLMRRFFKRRRDEPRYGDARDAAL